MNNSGIKTAAVFVMLCLIWGSTWLAIKAGLESLTPLYSAAFRFITASLIILLIMKIRRIRLQRDPAAVKIYIIQSLFAFCIPFSFIYWAEQFVPSGLAAVLFAVYPFFITIISYLTIPEEKINIYKIIGTILGFGGIVIIFSKDLTGDMTLYVWGMAAVVTAAFMQAASAAAVKKIGVHLNPLSMNLFPMAAAGMMLIIAASVFEDAGNLVFDGRAVISVLYLAVFGSVVTFTSYYWLLKRMSIVILSLVAFITPITALFLGWAFAGEAFTREHLAGSGMVLLGIITANAGNFLKTEYLKRKQEVGKV